MPRGRKKQTEDTRAVVAALVEKEAETQTQKRKVGRPAKAKAETAEEVKKPKTAAKKTVAKAEKPKPKKVGRPAKAKTETAPTKEKQTASGNKAAKFFDKDGNEITVGTLISYKKKVGRKTETKTGNVFEDNGILYVEDDILDKSKPEEAKTPLSKLDMSETSVFPKADAISILSKLSEKEAKMLVALAKSLAATTENN